MYQMAMTVPDESVPVLSSRTSQTGVVKAVGVSAVHVRPPRVYWNPIAFGTSKVRVSRITYYG